MVTDKLLAKIVLDSYKGECNEALGVKARFIQVNEVQVVMGVVENEHLVIAFPGTQCISDVFSDLNRYFGQTEIENSMFHAGFKRQFDKILPTILDESIFKPAMYRTVFVTGHSLGGALARHMVRYMLQEGWCRTQLVTFGEPASHTNYFDNFFNSLNVRRYVMDYDPVPHTDILGCVHFEKPRMLGKERNFINAIRFLGRYRTRHYMNTYYKELRWD